jgi:5-methylcytosine-specific restriction protein A
MTVTVCREPGCPNLRPCAAHPAATSRDRPTFRPSAQAPRPDTRPTAATRGYDAKWRRTRGRYLQLHPRCEHAGCAAPAVDVHHLDMRGPLGPRGHDHANLQALCHSHHSTITARTTNGSRSA